MEIEKTWEGKEEYNGRMMRTAYSLHLKGNSNMKYRKKPVEVDAIQFEVDSIEDLINFVTETTNLKILEKLDAKTQKPIGLPAIIIDTLEGMMTADLGDWIVKGVEGEFYPVKPDIFEKTYEKVEEI